MAKKIDVCLSPELLPLYDLQGKIVVVIDIFRATSCMTTALAHGAAGIIPVSSIEECRILSLDLGCLSAAERDGQTAEGFTLGNSPFSYMDAKIKGETIIVTTTNGTQAIQKSAGAAQLIVGSFLNLSAIVEYLSNQSNDILLVCAGWKGKPNAEDTLFAGAVVAMLGEEIDFENDSAKMAMLLFEQAGTDLLGFLADCSHVRRLLKLGIEEDIRFCLSIDKYQVVPILQDGKIIAFSNKSEYIGEQV